MRPSQVKRSGIQRIFKVCDRRIFKFNPNFLRVSFPIKNVGENIFKPNNTQKKIISLIEQNKHITQAEISEQLNRTVRTIERNMKKLQEAKVIVRLGSDTSGYWDVVKY